MKAGSKIRGTKPSSYFQSDDPSTSTGTKITSAGTIASLKSPGKGLFALRSTSKITYAPSKFDMRVNSRREPTPFKQTYRNVNIWSLSKALKISYESYGPDSGRVSRLLDHSRSSLRGKIGASGVESPLDLAHAGSLFLRRLLDPPVLCLVGRLALRA